MTHCCIALGANLNDPAATFQSAADLLCARGLKVLRQSSLLRTPAMGKDAGAEFLNAAVIVESSYSPAETLDILLDIERRMGRRRTITWGPRVIDLDLIFFGDQIVEIERLVVPHPLMWFRRFVLTPVAEIAGDWVHPALGVTVQELLDRIDDLPYTIHVEGIPRESLTLIESRLKDRTGITDFTLIDQPDSHCFASIDVRDPGPRICDSQPPLERSRLLHAFAPEKPQSDVGRIAQLEEFLQDVLVAASPSGQ